MAFLDLDLVQTETGDLVVDSNGDLKLSTEEQCLQQDILFRLKTDHLDYEVSPFLGANLGSIFGEPNTERTGDLIKEQVHISLTQDNRIPNGVLFVEAVPVGINSVQVFVIVSDRIGNQAQSSVVSRVLDLQPTDPGEESILNIDN